MGMRWGCLSRTIGGQACNILTCGLVPPAPALLALATSLLVEAAWVFFEGLAVTEEGLFGVEVGLDLAGVVVGVFT